MDYEVNWVHLKILVGFLLVGTLFGFAFYSNYVGSENNSLVGYVIFEGGTKISTEKLSPELVQEIQSGNSEPKIVVMLKEDSDTISEDLEERKTAIEEVQQQVISDLRDEIEVELPEETVSDAAFEVTQQFDTINAIAGQIKEPEALKEITDNRKVQKILLDYPVTISLDQSAAQINAPAVWNITIDNGSINGSINESIDGSGETVCIIDTGIDYTHPALGGCNPVSYELNGTVEELSSAVESAHPYIESFDYTWNITKSGYTNIAVHFTNFSLEEIGPAGDTLDRIYVYDTNHQALAIYKGIQSDFWTPYGTGDTIYVRLVSDGSVSSYGFKIDQVINGTTNTTMNWDNCSKVIGGWDTYNNDNNPIDDQGHGTHVAGIIGSTNETYRGIAPGAKLIAIKAMSESGGGYSSDVAAGIEWCNQNAEKYNISIISMSLGCDGGGCPHYQTHCTNDLTSEAIEISYSKNISVFIAAGNSGWTDGISNPSCVEHAIPVGGVNENDEIWFNRGNLLKILVPAIGITSAAPEKSWRTLSGTSMATPHAAGAAALVREYYKKADGIALNANEVYSKLVYGGVVIHDAGSGLNFSRIDVLAAVTPQSNDTNNNSTNNITDNLTNSSSALQINIISPQNNSQFNESFWLNYTVSGLNLSVVKYEIINHNGTVLKEYNHTNISQNISHEELLNVTELGFTNGSLMVFAQESNGSNMSVIYNLIYNLTDNITPINTSNSTSNNNTNNFSVLITSPLNGTIIEAGNLTLFNAASNSTGSLTYFWNFGEGSNSTLSAVSRQYNITGNFTVTVNITSNNSGNISSGVSSINIIVNDSQPPLLNAISYAAATHTGKELGELVNATLSDYSGTSLVKLYHGSTLITPLSTNNTVNTYLWNITSLVAGNNSFTIEAMDNSTFKNAKNYTYNFTVSTCTDGIKNGEEAEIDCGGYCANCTVVAAVEETSAVEPAPQVVEEQVSTAAAPVEEVKASTSESKPINWTSGLKEEESSRKETALYILGGLVILLLAIYAAVGMRE